MLPPIKLEKLTNKELIDFMNLNGLSPKELGDILGVTVQAVNLWIEDRRVISMTTTRLIRMFQKYPMLLSEFGRC